MGVHEFDQARWLTGQELGTLSMTVSTVTSVAPVPGDVESAEVLVALSGGAVAFISLGRHFPHGDCVWVEVMEPRSCSPGRPVGRGRRRSVPRRTARPDRGLRRQVRAAGPGSGASAGDARAALAAAEQAQQSLQRATAAQ